MLARPFFPALFPGFRQSFVQPLPEFNLTQRRIVR